MLDLKELSAVAVIRQFKKSVKPGYKNWNFKDQGDESCQFPKNLDIHGSYFDVCKACTLRQWIKQWKLPKELESFCKDVHKKWHLYVEDSGLQADPEGTDSEEEDTSSEDESSVNFSEEEETTDEGQGEEELS